MTNWLHRLELRDLLTEEEDPATVRRVAGEIQRRLEAFRLARYPEDADLADLVAEFEIIADDPEAELVYFNTVLSGLYDWADVGHRLWIA